MQNRFSRKNILIIASVFMIFCLGTLLYNGISRAGKVKISMRVIPRDSKLSVNGNPVSSKSLYLKPGEYTFSASKDGFTEDKITLNVKQSTEISLAPAPESQEAKDWLAKNPETQYKREAIGGQQAALRSEEITKQTPLIKLLPYEDNFGSFRVDYGGLKNKPNKSFIEVNAPYPGGREDAIKWIKDQGYDPTDYEIRYPQYDNPLVYEEAP